MALSTHPRGRPNPRDGGLKSLIGRRVADTEARPIPRSRHRSCHQGWRRRL